MESSRHTVPGCKNDWWTLSCQHRHSLPPGLSRLAPGDFPDSTPMSHSPLIPICTAAILWPKRQAGGLQGVLRVFLTGFSMFLLSRSQSNRPTPCVFFSLGIQPDAMGCLVAPLGICPLGPHLPPSGVDLTTFLSLGPGQRVVSSCLMSCQIYP